MAKTYEESIASLEDRIRQLQARRRDEVARHDKRERNAKKYATFVLGTALLDAVGDWHQLDLAEYASLLDKIKQSYRERLLMGGEVDSTTQALSRYRDWSRKRSTMEDSAGNEATASEVA